LFFFISIIKTTIFLTAIDLAHMAKWACWARTNNDINDDGHMVRWHMELLTTPSQGSHNNN